MRILDLGGTVESWRRAPVRPATSLCSTCSSPGTPTIDRLRPVTGDACDARAALAAAGAATDYDLVFSNSLIEHVGGHAAAGRTGA